MSSEQPLKRTNVDCFPLILLSQFHVGRIFPAIRRTFTLIVNFGKCNSQFAIGVLQMVVGIVLYGNLDIRSNKQQAAYCGEKIRCKLQVQVKKLFLIILRAWGWGGGRDRDRVDDQQMRFLARTKTDWNLIFHFKSVPEFHNDTKNVSFSCRTLDEQTLEVIIFTRNCPLQQ